MENSKLIPGSLYENIAGSAPLTREQVEEAIRRAALDADVAAMPMGLKTYVGRAAACSRAASANA
jgi:ABC-type bacteriocin/lantibiotic exporter with double-glycine peptidase domain